MATLKIIRVFYLEESIHDGAYETDHVEEDVYTDIHASEAARILTREGLSFKATGTDWACDPDGSYCSDYATGMQIETSGHLDGFLPRVHNAIIEKVG